MIKRVLREPLVQFLLGGALLFALYGVVAEDAGYAPDRIVIDADRVANLATTFQRMWLRPPTKTGSNPCHRSLALPAANWE